MLQQILDTTSGLTPDESRRYARHLNLPGMGAEGQLRLKQSRVLVVGAGGLGAPLLTYLAAAGVGRIGIVDPDRVSLSNLQRQVLFGQSDLGQLKVEAARRRLLDLNPLIQIDVYPTALHSGNAAEIMAPYDIIADGTDNFPTRYLVNDACVLLGKVNVHAAIFRFEGQVSVFNFALPDGSRSPNYRDLFPTPPPPDTIPSCAEGGVLGVLPGIIGSMQASEVIKLATGIGDPLAGRLFIFDAARFESRMLRFKSRPDTRITTLINYEEFCGSPAYEALPTIDITSLQALMQQQPDLQLIDVREHHEHQLANLGGRLIPLARLQEAMPSLNKQLPVVLYCQSGARSTKAAQLLITEGFTQVFHLEGGIQSAPTTPIS